MWLVSLRNAVMNWSRDFTNNFIGQGWKCQLLRWQGWLKHLMSHQWIILLDLNQPRIGAEYLSLNTLAWMRSR
ncbi:hypothetical protein PS2_046333 [Malus domestica]